MHIINSVSSDNNTSLSVFMFHILLEGFIIGDRQLDTHKIPIFPCGRTNTNQVPSYITKCLSSKNLVIFY